MKNLFWDSSAIVKPAHIEQDSDYFNKIFNDEESRHFASAISMVEATGAIMKKQRDSLTKTKKNHHNSILKDFSIQKGPFLKTWNYWRFSKSKSFSFIMRGAETIREAESLIIANEMRTLDAIILATLLIHLGDDKGNPLRCLCGE